MALYTWLKENPQERGPIIRYDWTRLSRNFRVGIAVRKELETAVYYGMDDATLFFIEKINLCNAIDRYHADIECIKNYWWIEKLYTILQLRNALDDINIIVSALRILSSIYSNDLGDLRLSFKQLYLVFDKYLHIGTPGTIYYLTDKLHLRSNTTMVREVDSIYPIIMYELTGCDLTTYNLATNITIRLLKNCSIRFLESLYLQRDKLNKVAELLNDIKNKENKVFTSINSIQRAHDTEAEQRAKELLGSSYNTKYIYHPGLLDILKGTKYFIPSSPAALVKRGIDHHNCIASYAGKHKRLVSNGIISRVIFSEYATVELTFEVWHDLIMSTGIPQMKGRYNKNIEPDTDIQNIRIKLIGKSVEILRTEEVENDQG